MGTAMSTAMGSDFWSSITSIVQEKYVRKTAIRTVLTGDGKNGSKPVSPVLAKMAAMGGEETLAKGGRDLNWVVADTLPDAGLENPYAADTASRKPLFQQAKLDWSFPKVNILIYGADQLMATGPEAVVNKMAEEMDLASVAMADLLARRFYADGTTEWQGLQATPAAAAIADPAGSPAMFGLGQQTTCDTVTNAIMANSNTYATIDRTAASAYRLRANILLCTSTNAGTAGGMGASGAVTNISDLTLAHIQHLITTSRRGTKYPNMVTCGQDVYNRLATIANAKGMIIESNTDKDLNFYGIANFKVNGATVVADPDYCPPTQINCFSVDPQFGIRLYFQDGGKPTLTQGYDLPLEGRGVKLFKLEAVAQYAALHPGLVGCIYGLTVA